MALLRLDPFVAFLGACADRHDGYTMGAVGQNPKELHEWYFNQYKDRTQYTAAQEAQALRWKEEAERVWDCQGLADGYLTEKLGQKINVRARNNYASWCGMKGEGTIPVKRRVPGAAVFMDNGSYIHHVGFLEKPVLPGVWGGDWWIVEARGVMYGVVRTKLSERKWNRWGWMTKYFDYSEYEAEDGSDRPQEYGQRMLRRGSVGEDVRALQEDLIALGYDVGRYGADGDFGPDTEDAVEAFQLHHGLEVDGIAGPETYGALFELFKESGEEQTPEEPEKTIRITEGYTWNIRTQPTTSAPVRGIAHLGDEYAEGELTAEGWINIIHNGQSVWVSGRAVAA